MITCQVSLQRNACGCLEISVHTSHLCAFFGSESVSYCAAQGIALSPPAARANCLQCKQLRFSPFGLLSLAASATAAAFLSRVLLISIKTAGADYDLFETDSYPPVVAPASFRSSLAVAFACVISAPLSHHAARSHCGIVAVAYRDRLHFCAFVT